MKSCLGPLPPRQLSQPLPAGTVDTHCHVIGPESQYPFSQDRTYTPPESTLSELNQMRDTFGIKNSVIVQPGAHGFDNSVTLDAVRALGGSGRGIVVVPVSTPFETLKEMNKTGIRGLRLSSLLRGDAGLDGLLEVAQKVEPLNWHILIHLKSSEELLDIADAVRNCPVPVILDHMARVTGDEGVNSPAFRCLMDLLTTTDHVWTKICSWYRLSSKDDWSDMRLLAHEVIDKRLERVLWGTNWPHPLLFEPPMPDDGDLIECFTSWAKEKSEQILVKNPLELYDFS